MIWMSADSVAAAVRGCENHAILSPAARFLDKLIEETNDQSDGWMTWEKPCRASQRLQAFIKKYTGEWSLTPNSRSNEATMKEFLETLTPIRSLVTRSKGKFKFDVTAALAASLDNGKLKPCEKRKVVIMVTVMASTTKIITEDELGEDATERVRKALGAYLADGGSAELFDVKLPD